MSENQQSNSDWVTIASVEQLHEAHLIKSILEETDIVVFLKDMCTAQTYVNAWGGIQIQVPGVDAERAYRLLVDGGYLPTE